MTRVLKVLSVLSALLQGPTSLFRNKLQELTSWEFLACSQESGKVCVCGGVCVHTCVCVLKAEGGGRGRNTEYRELSLHKEIKREYFPEQLKPIS